MTTTSAENISATPSEKKFSFLDADTLRKSDRMLVEGKEKLKTKIFIALEQDIEKIRIARNLDLFTKLKFLKFLTSTLVFYGSEESIPLIEKTLYLLNELKRRNIMYVEDRVFHEFIGACSRELLTFCVNELYSQQSLTNIFLEEYAHQYINPEHKGLPLYYGFQIQTLGFELFIHFCLQSQSQKQTQTISMPTGKTLNINENKTYSNLLAKHLKEFPKFNLYGQMSLFEKLKNSKIIKDMGGHLERYTKQNINISGVIALFYEYQLVLALKFEESQTWRRYLKAFVEKLVSQLNSSWSSLLEKQAFLMLLLLTFETYQRDASFEDIGINLMPFENVYFKLQKLFVCFLNENVYQATPNTLELFINHFQTFRYFSSESTIFDVIWKLFKFLVFRFPFKQHVDKAFAAVISFVEEKPALNSQLVHILQKLGKATSKTYQDIYYYICKKVQTFLLRKHPGDLMHYFPLIVFFIEENFDKSVLDIIQIFKKVLLSEGFSHEHSFIIASNTLYSIKKIITLYSHIEEFPLLELKQILEDFQELDDSYLREECLTLLKFLKVLPKERFLEFIEPTTEDIQECFMLLSREGHGESIFSKEQFFMNFDFQVSKKERKARGILDNGSAFAVRDLAYELDLVVLKGTAKNDGLEKDSEDGLKEEDVTSQSNTCIHSKVELVEFFEKFHKTNETKEDLFCFAVDFSKKMSGDDEEKIIPAEIFNLEFSFPGLDWLSCANSICIPYLSTLEEKVVTKRITFVIRFETCNQGCLDVGVSFTDMAGNIFCGIIPLIELTFKDFFVKVDFPVFSQDGSFAQDLKAIQESEGINLSSFESNHLLYYFYLQETYCKVESMRILRQPAASVLKNCQDFLNIFEVHTPYKVTESDKLGLKYCNLMYPTQKCREVDDSVIVPQEKIINRVLIGLPQRNFLCLLFSIQETITTIKILTSSIDILQFLDEYFDEWLQVTENNTQ